MCPAPKKWRHIRASHTDVDHIHKSKDPDDEENETDDDEAIPGNTSDDSAHYGDKSLLFCVFSVVK